MPTMLTKNLLIKWDKQKVKLSNEKFKIVVNLKWIKKSKQVAKRLNKSNKKILWADIRKLRGNLDLGENVFLLGERIKKKSALGKFYSYWKQFSMNKILSCCEKMNNKVLKLYFLSEQIVLSIEH